MKVPTKYQRWWMGILNKLGGYLYCRRGIYYFTYEDAPENAVRISSIKNAYSNGWLMVTKWGDYKLVPAGRKALEE